MGPGSSDTGAHPARLDEICRGTTQQTRNCFSGDFSFAESCSGDFGTWKLACLPDGLRRGAPACLHALIGNSRFSRWWGLEGLLFVWRLEMALNPCRVTPHEGIRVGESHILQAFLEKSCPGGGPVPSGSQTQAHFLDWFPGKER